MIDRRLEIEIEVVERLHRGEMRNPGHAHALRGFRLLACAPYRARAKRKTEAAVKYVKRNALAVPSATPSYNAHP
jgi:transposase